MEIRGVIFDMDGLLIDSETMGLMAWPEVGRRFGYAITREMSEATLGISYEEGEKFFQAKFGPEFTYEKILPHFIGWIRRYMEVHGVPVKPGARELLAYLRARGIPRALGSSNYREYVYGYLDGAGLTESFDAVVCGDMVGSSKPEPDIFLKCTELLGLPPETCLVLEDSPMGILAAHRAGCIPAMVPDLVQPDEATRAMLWRQFNSLEEVPGALEKIL